MSVPRLLIIEDDASLSLVLSDAMRDQGYEVTTTDDGRKGLALARTEAFDLLLLDLMLPGMGGYEICERLRADGLRTQIIMLTARGREEDKIKGLDLGADDYLAKPFSLDELLARVRARLRAARPDRDDRFEVGTATVDFRKMVIEGPGGELAMTPTESGVLRILLEHPGEVIGRSRFLEEVWGYKRAPSTRTVDMHVARVREKLGHSDAIVTVHGMGYRYDPPSPPQITSS